MQVSSLPVLFSYAWGYSASGSYIRTIPQTTVDANAASLQLGFPPNVFVDPAAGGEPPDGRDFNGILNEITLWLQWMNGGGPIFRSATWSTANGGYAKWAMVSNATTTGLFWISTADNNTSDPDAGGANWIQFPPTAAANVSSFNTRTGAVTLTSSDVTSALSANAVALGKIALAPALTLLSNVSGSGASGVWNTVLDVLTMFGFNYAASGNNFCLRIPYPGGILRVQAGTVLAGTFGDATITYNEAFTNAPVVLLTAVDGGTGQATAKVVTTPTTTNVAVKTYLSGAGAPNTIEWIAAGI